MNIKKIFLSLLAVVCVLSCLTLPALAAEPDFEVPEFPQEFENQGYLLYANSSDFVWLLLFDKDTVRTEFYMDGSTRLEARYVYIRSVGADYKIAQTYLLNDNGTWTKSGSTTPSIGFSVGGSVKPQIDVRSENAFYYSTESIYTDYNLTEPFFPRTPLPVPLWVEVLTATEANKNLLNQNKTLLTLTLCGVGLIALLIGLSLFGKVLKRFQVK